VADLARRNGLRGNVAARTLKDSGLRFLQRGHDYWIRNPDVKSFVALLKATRISLREQKQEFWQKWSQPVEGDLAQYVEDEVYLIRCGGFVKIGYANDVRYRLRTLRLANPHEITLIGSARGGKAAEAELHRRFATYHHRGEWFRIEGTLREFIEQIEKAQKVTVSSPACEVQQ
jgi:hypothetical protein